MSRPSRRRGGGELASWMSVTFPLNLHRRGDAFRSDAADAPAIDPAAWFISGGNVDVWMDEITRWGVATSGLRLYVVPTSSADLSPAGVLVVLPGNVAPLNVLRAQPYQLRAGRLFLPVDAALVPPVSDDELRQALRLGVQVIHPSAGLVGFSTDEALAVHDLVAPPALQDVEWDRADPGEWGRPRLIAVEPAEQPTAADVLEHGRDDIGSE